MFLFFPETLGTIQEINAYKFNFSEVSNFFLNQYNYEHANSLGNLLIMNADSTTFRGEFQFMDHGASDNEGGTYNL